MRILLVIAMCLICTLVYADSRVDLTTEQIQKLDLIHQKCKAEYPSFGGFYSGKDGVYIMGKAPNAQAFIDAIDLKEDTDIEKDKKALRGKLKALGLSEKEAEIIVRSDGTK